MHYAKISPRMVNPRDIAGKEEEGEDYACGLLMFEGDKFGQGVAYPLPLPFLDFFFS